MQGHSDSKPIRATKGGLGHIQSQMCEKSPSLPFGATLVTDRGMQRQSAPCLIPEHGLPRTFIPVIVSGKMEQC